MEVKAIVKLNKKRVIFYESMGKYYVVSEHWGKKHYNEDFCMEVTKEDGNKIYKSLIANGFVKCSKEVCEKYVR